VQRLWPALVSLGSFGRHGVGPSCDKTNVVIVMQLVSARQLKWFRRSSLWFVCYVQLKSNINIGNV
jgi:hypothetical protein